MSHRSKPPSSRATAFALVACLVLLAFAGPVIHSQPPSKSLDDDGPYDPTPIGPPDPPLDENCVVAILNRAARVAADGKWSIVNIPANFGEIRARATCVVGGVTHTGQSDPFLVPNNGVVSVGEIKFDTLAPVPSSLLVTSSGMTLTSTGAMAQLTVKGMYPNGSMGDLTTSPLTSYVSSNSAVGTVNATGKVTASSSGALLITVLHEAVTSFTRLSVVLSNKDSDGDGIADDVEVANGLNPNNPVDAEEDPDHDGLKNKQELLLGTNIRKADTDADGLKDAEEGPKGTDPLVFDSDGDGVGDGLEVLVGTSPTSAGSCNFSLAMQSLEVTPASFVLTLNAVAGTASLPLKVTGHMKDNSTVDLTSTVAHGCVGGTVYSSSNDGICNFGSPDGTVFAGIDGNCTVTVTNSGKSSQAAGTVSTFQPKSVSFVTIPGFANDVDVANGYAYVAAGSAGLQVVDVRNPLVPVIAGSLDTDGNADDVRVSGKTAYVADGPSGLKIIDVANPAAPQLKGSLDTPGDAEAIALRGNRAFVADATGGLAIIDVSSVFAPALISTFIGPPGATAVSVRGLDVVGNLAALAMRVTAGDYTVNGFNGIVFVNIANEASPVYLGRVAMGDARGVVIQGNYAFVADFTKSFTSIDITDPAHPVLKLSVPYLSGGYLNDVAVAGRFAAGADVVFANSIPLIDVADGANPLPRSLVNFASIRDDNGTGITMDGQYLYLTADRGSLSDNGVTGDSRLYIGQYQSVTDVKGVPPTVALTSPKATDAIIEGQTITLKATATDDVGVSSVTFLVGLVVATDNAEPFEFSYDVPVGAMTLQVLARAVDFGNNTTSAPVVVINILPDKDDDSDGLKNLQEVKRGTNPLDPDSDDDGLTDGEEVAAGTDPLNPDRMPPTVIGTNPVNGEPALAINRTVSIQFSEPIRVDTATPSSVQLFKGLVSITGSVTASADGLTVTFKPSALLDISTLYNCTVSGIRDRAGNPMASPYTFGFTTSSQSDFTGPAIISVNPINTGTSVVPINSTISVLFNEPLNVTTLTNVTFRLIIQSTGLDVSGTRSLDAGGRQTFFVPDAPLSIGTTYYFFFTGGVQDLAGNPLADCAACNSAGYYFTTAFSPDTTPPLITAISPQTGETGIALNASPTIQMNEALNPTSVMSSTVDLKRGGTTIAATLTLEDGNRRVRVHPSSALMASSAHTLTIQGLRDVAGNTLAGMASVSFTTGTAADTTAPVVIATNPFVNATGVARSVIPSVQFNEKLDSTSLTTTTVSLFEYSTGIPFPGTFSVDPGLTTVTFSPAATLAPETTYCLNLYPVSDVAGNLYYGYYAICFTTNSAVGDSTPPTITGTSPVNASMNVPVNTKPYIRFSEPMNGATINAASVSLAETGGASVAFSLALSDSNQLLVLTPATSLKTNTDYTLTINGARDPSLNPLALTTIVFKTNPSATTDQTGPSVSTVVPANNAAGASQNPVITLTFNEALSAATVSGTTINLTRDSYTGQFPATVSLNAAGTVVTLTPSVTLLPLVTYRVNANGMRDIAGNFGNYFSSLFTTAAGSLDMTPPTVAMISPASGATGVSVVGSVVLMFSEPLDTGSTSLSTDTVALIAGGVEQSITITRSADNTVVTIDPYYALPPATGVTVVLTSGLKDLGGNSIAPYRSTFTTGAAADVTRPQVTSVRPPNGATDVSASTTTVLFFNEPIDPATAGSGIFHSENGSLKPGVLSPDALDEVVTFSPANPYAAGAMGDVFVTTSLTDAHANALQYAFHSIYHIALDPAQQTPTITAYEPSYYLLTPQNVVFTARFSEPMSPVTFNSTNVTVLTYPGNGVVAGTRSLDASGRLFKFVPDADLPPNTFFCINFPANGVKDLQTIGLQYTYSYCYTTTAMVDLTPPTVTSVSPKDLSTGIGVNGALRIRFSEPVNTLTVSATTIQLSDGTGNAMASAISFTDSDMTVTIVPHAALHPNTLHTVTISGVTDKAGVPVVPLTTTFTTGAGADLSGPSLVVLNPSGTDVPINSMIEAKFDEVLDPASVNSKSVTLQNASTNANVAGTIGLDPSGRVVEFTPLAALAPGTTYYFYINTGVQDPTGNAFIYGSYTSFTASFTPDLTPPVVTSANPAQGDTAVPVNAAVTIQFGEPIDPSSVNASTVDLRTGGIAVPGTLSLEDGNRRIRLRPANPLASSSSFTLTIAGVMDISGNSISPAHIVSFNTGSAADLVSPAITGVNPVNGGLDVARNVTMTVVWSKAMNPMTLNAGTVLLQDYTTGAYLPLTLSLDATRKILTVAPVAPMNANTYHCLYIAGSAPAGAQDTAGNFFTAYYATCFTTGETASDATPPTVLGFSPAQGASNVAINSPVLVRFSEPMNPLSVTSGTTTLTGPSGSVAATLVLSDLNRLLTLTPGANLPTSSAITATLNGVKDVSGNAAALLSFSFTTSGSAVVDQTAPSVQSVAPVNGTTGVSINTQVVFTMNETISPTSVTAATVYLTRSGFTGNIPATIGLNAAGTIITITPANPFLPNTLYTMNLYPVRDIAGNSGYYSGNFTTGAGAADTTAPTVVMVTPANGATGVSIYNSVTLAFSESLDASTVTVDAFALLAGGAEVSMTPSRSSDSTMITLDPYNPLPANSLITIVVTSAAKDLSGNPANSFRSSFTTGAATDVTRPQIVTVRPPNGAQKVSPTAPVTIYFNEPIAPATVTGGVFVSTNGVLAAGTLSQSANNQVITFSPSAPFTANALGEIFATTTLADPSGNPLQYALHDTFHVAPDPAVETPTVVSSFGAYQTVSLNTPFTMRFSEAMDPATITNATVMVQDSTNGQPVAGTISLSGGGTLLRFVPSASYTTGHYISLTLTTGIKDLTGTPLQYSYSYYFLAGTTTDTTAPTVTNVAPLNGSTGVAPNASIRVHFSEPVNTDTVDSSTIAFSDAGGAILPCTTNFMDSNMTVTIVPHGVLAASTVHNLAISGVTDAAGNTATPAAVSFTTGATVDFTGPVGLSSNPAPSATGVPVNAIMEALFDEPLDPGSVNAQSVVLLDYMTFIAVAGTTSLDGTGKVLFFSPSANLIPSHPYEFYITNGVQDYAGNAACYYCINSYFTTAATSDTTAPTVLATNPKSGDTGFGINGSITIQMSEALDPVSVSAMTVVLKQGVNTLSGALSLEDGNRRIRLRPSVPLASSAAHTFTLNGLKDVAGNPLASSSNVTFTTGAGADLLSPTVATVTPAYSATGVSKTSPGISFTFSEPVNPITVTTSTILLYSYNVSGYVAFTVSLNPAGTVVTITPAAALSPSGYHCLSQNAIEDLAGNPSNGSTPTCFTTGP